MIFETHAHYDDDAFDNDRKELLLSMEEAGIETIVNIGANIESCKSTLALCREYPFVYGALGVHPSDAEELNEETFAWLKQAAESNSIQKGGKIVAIGEIGLDYYWDKEEDVQENQRIWFEKQANLARELSLPMVVHSRDAAKDTMDMMKAMHAEEIGGIVHCYSYSVEQAKEYLKMGFYFGIGGVLTFSNAKKLKEVVEYLPMDAIVLETDCPYLAPVPNRGKRNSSLNLPYVAKEIAVIKGMDEEEVIRITRENAKRVYQIER
ncbi:MAG: TatD family hydrolase [Lachnospiraceae bacterium]|nr:TatD family hydrolase [Lachnospiraceae bacterium]